MAFTAVLFGLVSAVTWGAGDFSGGMAVKRTNPYGVVISAHVMSLVLMAALALVFGEPIPPFSDWLWGGAAGLCGGIGLALLYRALATRQMSVAAPVSALVAASLPVFVSAVSDGLPRLVTLAGFGLALTAVWLISGGIGIELKVSHLYLPVIAGLTFGAFFIFLHYGSSTSIFWTLAATRITSISGLLVYCLITGEDWIPTRDSWGWIALSSVLDAAGNTFYALSARMGRMDVAAVLGSLYPGSTVLLAWFILKERISRVQTVGILIALAAIVLITL
ncbi:DMT family transporter [Candidatus Villigracilis saccharophilus]|uniref:DMT family transporter n=1 Tax=Candidatus Villigracilis saccharophilus TaxID=3140684 RepID=UPI003135AAEC|nr:DMT family transporter [Anaerolineales bacterium]